MKRNLGYLLLLLFVFIHPSFSQNANQPLRNHIAIFTPLFLDSAFDQTLTYRYGKNFPKYFNPGLEFYEGACFAIDSLAKEGLQLDIHVFDTRSPKSGVSAIINKEVFDSIDLVIGQVNLNEARLLGNAAARREIPFINATYPNSAGITNNPDFIILNSTLETHCAAIYRFIQKNYALSPIVIFRKKGVQEDRLKSYFDAITKNTASVPLKLKYVILDNDFTMEDVQRELSADAPTVCIAGSLDVAFGEALTRQLAALHSTHASVVFGMPTWWDATDMTKPEYKDVEVFFTTPFYRSPADSLAFHIENAFKTKFYSRPTDMFFLGYETLYRFAHLLQLYGKNFGSSLSDKRFNVFTDFDIQPVIDPKTTTLNYFENRKIYFIKKVNGVVTGVF